MDDIAIDRNYPPVFFVGMNGSGTTMLLESMGRHPDLYAFPRETKIIPYLISSIDQFGSLEDDNNFLSLWNYLCNYPIFIKANSGVPLSVPKNWCQYPRELASVINAVFKYFSAQEGKLMWGEKTPQHIQHLPALHRLFPEAKFVHIIRDGRDCAASLKRRYQRTPELSIYRWKNIVKEGRTQGSKLSGLYIEVRYEYLTSNPEYWMKTICSFLDLPFSPEVLVSRRPKSGSTVELGHADSGISSNTGKWKKQFSRKQQLKLEAIAGNYLTELDYPVYNTQGNLSPSAVKFMCWKWADFMRELCSVVKRKYRTNRGLNWANLFHRVNVAIKQSKSNRY